MALLFSELLEITRECVPFRIVYDHLGLDYRGENGNTQCKCPFHGRDTHPSARIYDNTNSWFCFTCGISKTPFSFYKAIKEQNLTDSLYDFFTEFRGEILSSRPELAGEDFSKTEILSAYLKHQREVFSLGENLAARFSLLGEAPQAPVNKKIPNSQDIYRAVRDTWVSHYRSPNFLPLYFEFIQRMNRVCSPAMSEDECQQFNVFIRSLPSNLSQS